MPRSLERKRHKFRSLQILGHPGCERCSEPAAGASSSLRLSTARALKLKHKWLIHMWHCYKC